MKKGAIPIPYIIAIVLGLAIIGVIGYWFFSVASTAGGEGTESQCNSMRIAYCQEYVIRQAPPVLAQWDSSCGGQPTLETCRDLLGIQCADIGQDCSSMVCCAGMCDTTTTTCCLTAGASCSAGECCSGLTCTENPPGSGIYTCA